MGKTVIVPVFLQHEYDSVLALGNLELPATYEGWLERRANEREKNLARDFVEKETVIHPREFATYCQSCGQDASFATLNAFAVKESTKQ